MRLSTTTKPATAVPAEAVVIAMTQGADGPQLAPGSEPIAEAYGPDLLADLTTIGATGAADEVVRLATKGATPQPLLLAVGLGKTDVDTDVLRGAAGIAVRALVGHRSAVLALPDSTSPALQAICEGARLGAYAFRAGDKKPLGAATVVTGLTKGAKTAVRRAEVLSRAVNLTRDLVNTPPCDLTPAEFAARATSEAERAGLEVQVLFEKALTKGGYGGILGVGQGSTHPPRLVHLRYRAVGATQTVALVGKGVTFDSGGLSIKPSGGMELMKFDMGGAAAVLATVLAAAELGVGVNVDAWLPLAENMPSGTALRPSDVITLRGGKTVEVNNTDAEGRLILADAMVRACEDKPDVLVDVATLTGAAMSALGGRTTAVMGNDDDLRAAVVAAADTAGELMWPIPMPAHLKTGLESPVADLLNSPSGSGGMMSAGLFLEAFVAEGVRWAHLDIAGPVWNTGSPYGCTPKGATGAAVRTLVQLLEDLAGR